MLELIGELPEINRGRRLRLLGPLRQAPLICWEPLEDQSAEETLKAAMRVAIHELIDEYCCHLAGALARCDSAELKTLVGGLAAYLVASRVSVQFRDDNRLSGVWFASSETAIIEPAARVDGQRVHLLIERKGISPGTARRAAVTLSDDGASTNSIVSGDLTWIAFSPRAVRELPFRCAAEIWRQLASVP
jgi:hypothetical protein